MQATVHREECLLPAAGGPGESLAIHLLDCMQEAAGRHAEILGWGLRHLLQRDLTWVLARQHTLFLAPLPPGGRLQVATWPSGTKSLYALRDFRVTDGAGVELVLGTSAWLLLNISTRRPARIDGYIPDFSFQAGRALHDKFASLPEPANPETSLPYTVRPEDIDLNNHMNNLVYVEVALRSLPEGGPPAGRLLALEAAFQAEAFAGDVMHCHTQRIREEKTTLFLQSLRRDADGRELTLIRSRWE